MGEIWSWRLRTWSLIVGRAGMRTADPPIWPTRAGGVRAEITGMVGLEEMLARIALRNDRFISSLPHCAGEGIELDRRRALARLAVPIGIDGAMASFVASAEEPRTAGAFEEEIVDTLLVVLPSVGVVRASSRRAQDHARARIRTGLRARAQRRRVAIKADMTPPPAPFPVAAGDFDRFAARLPCERRLRRGRSAWMCS